MNTDTVWAHIGGQRRVLVGVLAELTPDEWHQASLCAGWTVRQTAAHLLASPCFSWSYTLAASVRAGFRFDTMVDLDARRRAEAAPEEILAALADVADSRRKPPMLSAVEPLLDILVHTQDLLRPLGRHHEPPVEPAAVAADRARTLSPLLHSRAVVRRVRMEATDIDWVRGSGPIVRGPMAELLMLCAGRPGDLTLLEGDGLALLAAGPAQA